MNNEHTGLAPPCPVLFSRVVPRVSGTLVSWQPKERDRRHFKGGDGKPPPQGRRREAATTQKAPTGEAQARNTNNNNNTQTRNTTNNTQQNNTTNNTEQHNTTTTQPPTHASQCAPYRTTVLVSRLVSLLILVCCLLLLVFASVLSVLPLFCPNARLSLCLDECLFVRMSVSVRLFVCLSSNIERFVV